MSTQIAWFRRGLRLADNPLVRFATPPEQLLCVYVLDERWLTTMAATDKQTGAVARYKSTRNGLLGDDFSTRLSPWLAHGCLSARQVHGAVRAWEDEQGACESSYWVIFELLWRDYFHWAGRQEGPALFGGRMLPSVGPAFTAWCQARTGVPFVDSAMLELASTGWLSTRARQNVASFLVKDLGKIRVNPRPMRAGI
jgi:deoxyribodipyrimidine photolyase